MTLASYARSRTCSSMILETPRLVLPQFRFAGRRRKSPCRRWMIGKRNGSALEMWKAESRKLKSRNQSCSRWISGRRWRSSRIHINMHSLPVHQTGTSPSQVKTLVPWKCCHDHQNYHSFIELPQPCLHRTTDRVRCILAFAPDL